MANVTLNQITQTNLPLKQEQEQTSYLNKVVRVVCKVIKVIFYPLYLAFKGCKFLFNHCVRTEVPAKNLIPRTKSNGIKPLNNPEFHIEFPTKDRIPQTKSDDVRPLYKPKLYDKYTFNFNHFLQKSLAIKPNIQITDKQLGSGKCGKVMLATLYYKETKTYKDVAVKILDKNNPNNTYKSFKEEVTTGVLLKKAKDTFVETIAAFEDNETNSFQIVMELADITFFKAISLFKDQDGKLPTDIIGVKFVHRALIMQIILLNNILSPDIHENNMVLFFEQNKIKICDFGKVHLRDTRLIYQQISSYCAYISTYNIADLKLDKDHATNPRLHNDDELFDDSQKEACKNYFLVAIEKYAITEENKAALIAYMDDMFVSNYYVFMDIGSLLSQMCFAEKDVPSAIFILEGYINFVKDTLGYRETFIEDAQKLYQAQQSNQKH